MKTCSRCNVSKNTSEFYRNATRADGLTYWCKECTTAHHKVTKSEGYVKKAVPVRRTIVPVVKEVPHEYYRVPTIDDKWRKFLDKLSRQGKVLTK